jgi:hypothetical protein
MKDRSLNDSIVISQLSEHSSVILLKLIVFNKMIPIKVCRPDDSSREIVIKTYPSISILQLKQMIFARTNVPVHDQTLSYNGSNLDDKSYLFDFNIKDADDSMVINADDINSTTTTRPYELFMFFRKNKDKSRFALGIDFSFNYIKNVTKLDWDEKAPWYREVSDGLSWVCYCRNSKCDINSEMFILHRGFGHFYLHQEMAQIKCIICKNSIVDIRNMGFVNCTWQYKGELSINKERKMYGDGRTYDNKFHTFKELNYKTIWKSLELVIQELDRRCVQNIIENDEESKNDKLEIRADPQVNKSCLIF